MIEIVQPCPIGNTDETAVYFCNGNNGVKDEDLKEVKIRSTGL